MTKDVQLNIKHGIRLSLLDVLASITHQNSVLESLGEYTHGVRAASKKYEKKILIYYWLIS